MYWRLLCNARCDDLIDAMLWKKIEGAMKILVGGQMVEQVKRLNIWERGSQMMGFLKQK